jgi:predicted CXXCH cytochrome family protein
MLVSTALAVVVCSCASSSSRDTAAPRDTAPPRPAVGSRPLEAGTAARASRASNVLRSDYAGSASCAPCHAKLYEKFASSPMHNMTRLDDAIRAPFDGAKFNFKHESATAFTVDGRPYVQLNLDQATRGADGVNPLYRVTNVIGGRVREDFVGVLVDDTRPDAVERGERMVLPVSYLLYAKRWRYKGYSVMVTEREGMHAGPVWRETCIFCHNEAPYLATIYNSFETAPTHTIYQGSVSDGFLPVDRRFRVLVDDPAALAAAVREEAAVVSKSTHMPDALPEAAHAAAVSTRKRFGPEHLVEMGIGCETCHNGSKAHVESKGAAKTSLLPQSPLFHVAAADGSVPSDAQAINHTCARCHTVLFSQYPYTWEGGTRDKLAVDKAGGSSINSGEARDFILGHCADKMSCVDCHDPHALDDRTVVATKSAAVCTKCHADDGHSHHDASVSCVDCHMAKKNAGLDGQLTPYHRIGSPTDDARVYGDRPLECAICHADKSVGAIRDDIARLWGKDLDRAKLAALYGSLAANALVATVERGKPHEQIVAAAALAEHADSLHNVDNPIPALVAALPHRYPLARPYLAHAIEAVAHKPLDVDLDLDAAALADAANAWLATQGKLVVGP